MNKVTTVNLNGRAYQVEEQAYEQLRAYLDEAARLIADDPDCREIMADLEQAIEVLKEAIAKENWEVKGKFPPGLKPILAQVALKAVILGEYDDNFSNLMPRLFPYNKFTMTVSRFDFCERMRIYSDTCGLRNRN